MPASTAKSTSGRAGRAGVSKNSLIVVLKLPPETLRQLTNGTPSSKSNTNQNNTPDIKGAERSSPASSAADLPAARPSSADNASDADATSTPAAGAAAGQMSGRKGAAGPKPGNKRPNGQTEPSSRAKKPAPKKRPRLDEGGESGRVSAPSRLGPKANTGAINAGLRALDRSGAPCRRWERKPFQLKSFTGIYWKLPSWRSPKPSKLDEAVEAKAAALESGDSDIKPTLAVPDSSTANGSSAVPSEKSQSGDGEVTPAPSNPVESSSPAIAMAA